MSSFSNYCVDALVNLHDRPVTAGSISQSAENARKLHASVWV